MSYVLLTTWEFKSKLKILGSFHFKVTNKIRNGGRM